MSEKKVYAMAPEGCKDYIVAGKVYLTRPFYTSGDDSEVFEYYDEEFSEYSSPWAFTSWQSSPHLNGGNWTRLELTEEEAEAINAKLSDPLDSHPNSEPDADECSVVADTIDGDGSRRLLDELLEFRSIPLQYDPEDVAFTQDNVNTPSHYTSGEIECIDAIQAQMTPDQFAGYLRGNVAKYVWRYQHKGGKESLLKAQWYLNRLIDVVE